MAPASKATTLARVETELALAVLVGEHVAQQLDDPDGVLSLVEQALAVHAESLSCGRQAEAPRASAGEGPTGGSSRVRGRGGSRPRG